MHIKKYVINIIKRKMLFIQTLLEPYNENKVLCISPDSFWLNICSEFSLCISQSKRFTDIIIKNKQELDLKYLDTIDVTDPNTVEYIIENIQEKTYIPLKLILPTFTTSSPVTKCLCALSLLSNTKNNVLSTELFINKEGKFKDVKLEGIEHDWLTLLQQILELREYISLHGIGPFIDYIDRIIPVLHNIIRYYRNNLNMEIWNEIFFEKANDIDDNMVIKGWITALFHSGLCSKVNPDLENIYVFNYIKSAANLKYSKINIVGGLYKKDKTGSSESTRYIPTISIQTIQTTQYQTVAQREHLSDDSNVPQLEIDIGIHSETISNPIKQANETGGSNIGFFGKFSSWTSSFAWSFRR